MPRIAASLVAIATGLFLPASLTAQDARIDLSCDVIAATIDDVPVETIAEPTLAITIVPKEVFDDGIGFYSLTINDQTTDASNLSTQGPLVWSSDPGNVSILTIPSASGIYVLHTYWAVTTEPSATRFLVCEVV